MKTPYDRLAKIYANCIGHMIKMATTPIYGKYLFLWNQKANGLGTWYVALGMWALGYVRFAQMLNLCWPWPTLWQDQIWFLMHFYMGKILKCSFFYNCRNHNTCKKCLTNETTVLYKYQMSSWPVTFYPRLLIWTATYLSKHLFLRNHWAVWLSIH